MTPRINALAALLLVAGSAVADEPVWRCGPDGRAYGDAPCADGRRVAATDSRTDAQRVAAAETARREAALADRLQHERLAREAAQRPAPAVGLNGTPRVPAPAASAAAPPKGAKPPHAKKRKKKKPVAA